MRRWKTAFLAYFATDGASNGGTEAVNGIIELGGVAKRVPNFEHYTLRMLLVTVGLDASPDTLNSGEPSYPTSGSPASVHPSRYSPCNSFRVTPTLDSSR